MIIDNYSLSLEEKVFATLEEEILTGKLAPGEQLREQALAKRLDASRTPIRGALHRLAEEGLVELLANKGATVVGISREDIEDIYAIRIRLEGLAARLAAERLSESDFMNLKSIVEVSEFFIASGDGKKCGDIDSEFHKIIFNASGRRHLTKILTDLHKNTKAYRRLSLEDGERAAKSVCEHREIYNALARRNGDEAERLTVLHIEAALNHFRESFKKI